MMSTETYLQVISILIAFIAVAMPIGITAVGFVYIRQLTTRIDNLSAEVNLLWDEVRDK